MQRKHKLRPNLRLPSLESALSPNCVYFDYESDHEKQENMNVQNRISMQSKSERGK